MIKTFSLDKIEETQLSDKKGTMIFHLTDESGESRKVTGLTFLDENKVAKGITSVNKRELPLIQNLFEMELKETIDLEFKYFNDLYDRKLDKTVNQIAYETVLEMQKEEKLMYRIAHFFKKFTSSKEQAIISN
ncbi:MAG TPA: hypothetical protein EYH16_00145 [Leucothrix mucor]|nr:hypothetical protein [Leucothrix mucor]